MRWSPEDRAVLEARLSGACSRFGARVVAVARNPVEDFPTDAAWIQGGVSSVEGVQAIVEQVSTILGGVDILVNNAASGRIYPGGSLTVPDPDGRTALIRTSSRRCA